MSEEKRDDDMRLLKVEEVLDLFPFSRTTLWRLVRDGDFPAPKKIGSMNLWSYRSIKDWFDSSFPASNSRRRRLDIS